MSLEHRQHHVQVCALLQEVGQKLRIRCLCNGLPEILGGLLHAQSHGSSSLLFMMKVKVMSDTL
jgi:hypothetical protein